MLYGIELHHPVRVKYGQIVMIYIRFYLCNSTDYGETGSTQKHHNKAEVNIPPKAIHVIEENALDCKPTVDIPPDAITAVPIDDELKNEPDAKMQSIVVPAITLGEMKEITDDFSSKCLITKGSRESLYHGLWRNGQDVAVLKFNRNLSDQKFLEEVSTISSLEHENVVQLLGYCVDGGLQALVYEFAPRGSLHDILHGVLLLIYCLMHL